MPEGTSPLPLALVIALCALVSASIGCDGLHADLPHPPDSTDNDGPGDDVGTDTEPTDTGPTDTETGECSTDADCPGDEHCLDGVCVEHCEPGEQLCGDVCVDTQTDDDHCGECDAGCGEGAYCRSGQCECLDDWTECNGECANTTSDPDHCGDCGESCDDVPNDHAVPVCIDEECDFVCDENSTRCHVGPNDQQSCCEVSLHDDIDNSDDTGLHSSLTLVGDYDLPRISYYDAAEDELRYASWGEDGWDDPDNTDWKTHLVESDIEVPYTSLGADSSDTLHLAYQVDPDGDDLPFVRYARLSNESDAWETETPEADDDLRTGDYISLQLDTDGDLHIASRVGSPNNTDVAYARRETVDEDDDQDDDANWHTHLEINNENNIGHDTSLHVNDAGVPIIVHRNSTTDDVMFSDFKPAEDEEDEWETGPAGLGLEAGAGFDTAADDELHISIPDHGGDTLHYANFDPQQQQWEDPEVVDDDGLFDQTSMDVDSQGRPHIVYRSSDGSGQSRLKYAVRLDDEWFTTTVDDDVPDSIEPSMTVDLWDRPHFSYTGGSSDDTDLRYAIVLFPDD